MTFLNESHWLLDPFVGSGTTSVVAKERGVNSVGVEVHPLVHWVAKVKCFWEFDMAQLYQAMQRLITALHRVRMQPRPELLNGFPELVRKCYSDANLAKRRIIRDAILEFDCSEHERDFFRLALTDTLRNASKAGTGWPYIAPSKYHERQSERDGLEVFCAQLRIMYNDLKAVLGRRRASVETRLLL